ncbi:MAG TPA: hypothetical protein PKJ41_06720 [Bryobacteraceae bacterium]|nr:hypothetical protein [Bryobacteraceae bacterium]HPT27464.1 hypothetical protein [Bryobacteraceae bacterium]
MLRVVVRIAVAGLSCSLGCLAQSTDPSTARPKFEEYPVSEQWTGPAAAVRLTARSSQLFRTRLRNAGKEPANFAGHYQFEIWGCGSNCAAGGIIDLRSGEVFHPPLGGGARGYPDWIISTGMMEGSAIDFRIDSRLIIVKCGMFPSEKLQRIIPEEHYLL